MGAGDSAAPTVDWRQVRGVVFDLDGTLYDPLPLRLRMAAELVGHCALRPWRLGLPRRLQAFRRERERISEQELEGAGRLQYELPAARLGISPDRLRAEVEEWIERRPLRHLAGCRVPGVRRFSAHLRARGVRMAVLSDYPAAAKLAALGLEAEVVVSGVDPEVDRFKPHPAGLELVLARLDLPPKRCLVIGDRDDRDGACARRAGVECLLRGADFRTFAELLPGGGVPP